jgi:hypothetical protein
MPHATNSRTPASIWTHEPILTPERKLWRAVLEQAYADAELPLSVDGSEPVERNLARRFLRADSPHEAQNLYVVCEFADVPWDRVVLWARRRYPVEESHERTLESGSPVVVTVADQTDREAPSLSLLRTEN